MTPPRPRRRQVWPRRMAFPFFLKEASCGDPAFFTVTLESHGSTSQETTTKSADFIYFCTIPLFFQQDIYVPPGIPLT